MCMGIFGKKDYLEMRKAAGVKNDIPDIYKWDFFIILFYLNCFFFMFLYKI
jgi:hypothetical protein